MGSDNKIHQGAVVGALPQDFHFCGDITELVIGDGNIIRENVVINRATHKGGQTVIGNHNFLMEGSHISHDTKVGDHCVFGYGTDRKSTRLNSSHANISYAVFCLKKKKEHLIQS